VGAIQSSQLLQGESYGIPTLRLSSICQNYVISWVQRRKHWVQVIEDFKHILPGSNLPKAALASMGSSVEN